MHKYTLRNQEIDQTDFEQKDIGVILGTELKFDDYMGQTIQKRTKRQTVSLQIFWNLSSANFTWSILEYLGRYLDENKNSSGSLYKKLLTTFVRLHLKYDQAIYAPHLRTNNNTFENAQRCATKFTDRCKKSN